MPSVDRETAIALLDVQPARVVAMTADGTLFDEDGDAIDPRQTAPWVWALGPFGSWPERLEDAIAKLRAHTGFETTRSFRVGRVVLYKLDWWGYAIKPFLAADVYRAVAAALLSPLDALTGDQIDAAMNGGVEVTVRLRGGRWLAAAQYLGGNLAARSEGTTAAAALEALAAALVKLADGEVSNG